MGVGGRVDHHGDLAFLGLIADVRAALLNFVDHFGGNAAGLEIGRRAAGGDDFKADAMKFFRHRRHARFVFIAHADKYPAAFRQTHAGGELRLGEGEAERRVDAHDFAGGFHLRTEQGIDAGKFIERKHRFFDGNMFGQNLLAQTEIFKLFADHNAGRQLRQPHADGFADEGHGARGARIDLKDENILSLHGELHVHQTAHVERFGQRDGVAADLVLNILADGLGRQTARAVAGMNAGALDMLHDTADHVIVAVA